METIEESQVTDNLNVSGNEPSDLTDDNSSEPENNEPVKSEEENEAKKQKFDTLEAALEGYNNLEKKLGEQSQELGELRKIKADAENMQKKQLEIVQSYGFNSIEDFERHQAAQLDNLSLAKYQADLYAKHLDECVNADEVGSLLVQYRNNPNKELLEAIEAEFSTDTLKEVAGNVAIYKGQLEQEKIQAQEQQIYNSAKEYLDFNVNKYSEEFKNPAFTEFYGEAFKACGCDLNTDRFVELMRNFAASVLRSAGIKNGIANENKLITDEIAALTDGTAAQGSPKEKDILTMTEEEMRKELRKYRE